MLEEHLTLLVNRNYELLTLREGGGLAVGLRGLLKEAGHLHLVHLRGRAESGGQSGIRGLERNQRSEQNLKIRAGSGEQSGIRGSERNSGGQNGIRGSERNPGMSAECGGQSGSRGSQWSPGNGACQKIGAER